MLTWAATVTARFGGYPSDYIRDHDWTDLLLDHEAATVLNEIDQKKEEARWSAISGNKS